MMLIKQFCKIYIFLMAMICSSVIGSELSDATGTTGYRPVPPVTPFAERDLANLERDKAFGEKVFIYTTFNYKDTPSYLGDIYNQKNVFDDLSIFPTIDDRKNIKDSDVKGGMKEKYLSLLDSYSKNKDLAVYLYLGHGNDILDSAGTLKKASASASVPETEVCIEIGKKLEALVHFQYHIIHNIRLSKNATSSDFGYIDNKYYNEAKQTITNQLKTTLPNISNLYTPQVDTELEKMIKIGQNEYDNIERCPDKRVSHKEISEKLPKSRIVIDGSCYSGLGLEDYQGEGSSIAISSAGGHITYGYGSFYGNLTNLVFPSDQYNIFYGTSGLITELEQRINTNEGCILDADNDRNLTIYEVFSDFPKELSAGVVDYRRKTARMPLNQKREYLKSVIYDQDLMIGSRATEGQYKTWNNLRGFSGSLSSLKTVGLTPENSSSQLVIKFLSEEQCSKYDGQSYDGLSINKQILEEFVDISSSGQQKLSPKDQKRYDKSIADWLNQDQNPVNKVTRTTSFSSKPAIPSQKHSLYINGYIKYMHDRRLNFFDDENGGYSE